MLQLQWKLFVCILLWNLFSLSIAHLYTFFFSWQQTKPLSKLFHLKTEKNWTLSHNTSNKVYGSALHDDSLICINKNLRKCARIFGSVLQLNNRKRIQLLRPFPSTSQYFRGVRRLAYEYFREIENERIVVLFTN